MPARPEGVYQDGRGKWYFKVTVGHDPLTGRRTRSPGVAFGPWPRPAVNAGTSWPRSTAGSSHRPRPVSRSNELLDLYLDGIDADQNLALEDPLRLPPVRGRLHPALHRRSPGPRHHARGHPGLAAQAPKEGGAKRKKGKDGKPGPGSRCRRTPSASSPGSWPSLQVGGSSRA